ncbi:MAG: zf-HC2 domain-containing protein [Acidimicrobiales bacterium]|jgi:anti-sigma factor RsiW
MKLPTLRRDIVCRQAVELVTDYLEGALSRRDTRRFEAHLRACDGCDEYLRQVKATIEALGRVEPEDLAPETREGLMELYRQFLED